jgi:hypothetical protein
MLQARFLDGLMRTDRLKSSLRAFWQWLPFRHVAALTLALFLIKEQFPFSNFPMYSNFDTEADVLFITDQADQPVPMSKVFRTGSAATKKVYKAKLSDICNPRGRDTEQATAEERQQAAAIVLASLKKKIKPGSLPDGTTALRLHMRTFVLEGNRLRDRVPERLAEVTL